MQIFWKKVRIFLINLALCEAQSCSGPKMERCNQYDYIKGNCHFNDFECDEG